MREIRTLSWEVGHSAGLSTQPDKWVPATVPGAVQLDWARATGMGHYQFGDNHKEYRWMEDRFWTYRARLDPAVLKSGDGRCVWFVSRGIDYRHQVRIGSTVLHEQEGMYTPVEIDITEHCAPGAELFVTVWPVPKSIPDDQCPHRPKWQADQSVKPAVSYEWDFHPRLVPLCIWDETGFELRPACQLRSAEVRYALSDDLDRADISVDVRLSAGSDGGTVRWRLLRPDGTVALEQSAVAAGTTLTAAATLDHPALWWPNGQGEPHLYASETELVDASGAVVDRMTSRVGLRRIALVMQPGAWKEPSRYPKTRSTPPITLEINGRRIFAKGSNWVSPEIFPGLLTAATYRRHLAYAHEAHFNILRCWGGANVQKEAFFDTCDELGIMVWQEFTLACNNYVGTPAYLSLLDRESRSVILRLRPHASVVMWCGGNELLNEWSGMTDQSHALRLLNRNTFELDPARPFLTSSPVMGMAHGGYWFHSEKEGEVFEIFRNCAWNAYTEFGCDSPAFADTVRELLPPQDAYQPGATPSYTTDRAKQGLPPDGRMKISGVLDYFDPPSTLEEFAEKGQMLQGIGLQCVFEEARRQKPRCSMAISWCFNEPWPALANQAIIAWPSRPKHSYAYVKQALRPVLAGARIPKFRWSCGEEFEAQLWLLSDCPDTIQGGAVNATLRAGAVETPLCRWVFGAVAPNANLPGPTCRCTLPDCDAEMFELVLTVDDHPEWNSVYKLRLVKPKDEKKALQPRNPMQWT